tara:strand:+ start:380 stop:859 length:480 start_codon:yes stop_codon:yes gene_type:complete
MGDSLPTEAELDELIDAALRDEPLLPAPPHLHRKIEERVMYVALQERERARFRHTLIGAIGALFIIVTGAAVVITLTRFSLLYTHGVSGGKGLVDYYLTLFDVSWSSQIGVYALFLMVGLSIAFLWTGLMLLRGQMRLLPVNSGNTRQSNVELDSQRAR